MEVRILHGEILRNTVHSTINKNQLLRAPLFSTAEYNNKNQTFTFKRQDLNSVFNKWINQSIARTVLVNPCRQIKCTEVDYNYRWRNWIHSQSFRSWFIRTSSHFFQCYLIASTRWWTVANLDKEQFPKPEFSLAAIINTVFCKY